MMFLNRKLTITLCFAGFLLQSPQLEAWNARSWARQYPVAAHLVAGSVAVTAFGALQYKALKHAPDHVKQFLKKYPYKTILGALICVGILGSIITKALNIFCAPVQELEQNEPFSEPDESDMHEESNEIDCVSVKDGLWFLHVERMPEGKHRFYYEFRSETFNSSLFQCHYELMDEVQVRFPDYIFSTEDLDQAYYDARNKIIDAARKRSEGAGFDIGNLSGEDDLPARI